MRSSQQCSGVAADGAKLCQPGVRGLCMRRQQRLVWPKCRPQVPCWTTSSAPAPPPLVFTCDGTAI
jgi:hypothetical protein